MEAQKKDKMSGGRDQRTIRLVAPDPGPSQSNREWTAPHPSGSIKAQYAVLERIGDGGMGVVYLARDHKLGRHVALKRLLKTSLVNQSLKSRFFREARAVAALNHPYIVHIYALGEDEDGPYIAMEYVAGPVEASPNKIPPMPFSLADRVHRSGPLSVSDALDLMLKVCEGISYAHGCRVIHRDLKPSNVLLTATYEPKIVDFGLARKMNPDTLRLTLPGEKMLSLGYGAPEQESDATLSDERSDIYGLGGLLYFSLTGQNPRYFRESDVPEGLRMPIVKALETDRNKRWPTVRDFEAALQLVRAPSTIEVPTVKTTWRCKWCDTVNPVLIRYCGKCGWDGGEMCSECGSEIRVGIQFCGTCGANTREYEIAKALEARLQAYEQERSYELIIQQTGQISGFKPCGENGRRLVERVHRLSEDAARALARKSKLRDMIALDVSNRNYDLAERRISEYETLSKESPYADIKADIPRLRIDRDVERAMGAVSGGDLEYAAAIARDLENSAPADPRVQRLSQRLRMHRRRVAGRNVAVMLIALFGLYLLAAPPLYHVIGKRAPSVFQTVFALAIQVHDDTLLRKPLGSYASLWQADEIYKQPDSQPPPPTRPISPPSSAPRLAELRGSFKTSVDSAEAAFRDGEAAWPGDYLNDLAKMQTTMQENGDFEAWSAVTAEMERFRLDHALDVLKQPSQGEDPAAESPPEPYVPALAALRKRYVDIRDGLKSTRHMKIVDLCHRYILDLEAVQKELTKQGNMDSAMAVNMEIKRVRALPDFVAAEGEVARRKAAASAVSKP